MFCLLFKSGDKGVKLHLFVRVCVSADCVEPTTPSEARGSCSVGWLDKPCAGNILPLGSISIPVRTTGEWNDSLDGPAKSLECDEKIWMAVS